MTQSNHIFASIYAFFKLELLGVKSKINAAALRTKPYIKANRAAFGELENIEACFGYEILNYNLKYRILRKVS
jgi:hypothetical protein